MQKRLLITGANSFIGRYLVKEASAQGFKVIAVVRKNCKTRDSIENIHNVDIMEYDMNEYGGIGSRFKNVDCCVNLSWSGTRGSLRNDEEIQKENYENGLALFKSLLENGCKKIITVGSQAEYGNVDGIISEDTPCYPNTAYGKYKLKLYEELTTIAQKHNASYIDARIFSIYGPGDYENTLIMSLIKNMSLNKACDLTTCTQLWDYLYVEDAAKALLTLASKQCEDGVYNTTLYLFIQ